MTTLILNEIASAAAFVKNFGDAHRENAESQVIPVGCPLIWLRHMLR